jgi:hypothetical protein
MPAAMGGAGLPPRAEAIRAEAIRAEAIRAEAIRAEAPRRSSLPVPAAGTDRPTANAAGSAGGSVYSDQSTTASGAAFTADTANGPGRVTTAAASPLRKTAPTSR